MTSMPAHHAAADAADRYQCTLHCADETQNLHAREESARVSEHVESEHNILMRADHGLIRSDGEDAARKVRELLRLHGALLAPRNEHVHLVAVIVCIVRLAEHGIEADSAPGDAFCGAEPVPLRLY